ncbi:MAG: DUF4351 domain-containing protein [Moorea sp. SIO2B7]|nr:DUF4351 domain-containing protein [Moorena sp. SIO2B7]
MTRFIYDQFSKDYLDEILSPYGTVTPSRTIASERQEVDLFFSPSAQQLPEKLGLLGKLASSLCLFEPYRNPVTPPQIRACLAKLLVVEAEMIREFKRQKQSYKESKLPKLWILTPTASTVIIEGFAGRITSDLGKGVYLCGTLLRMGIVVIHQLPITSETLLLRLLGRGKVQSNAITEVESLSENNPLKSIILEQLYNLQQNLFIQNDVNAEDREVIMRLAPLYQEDRARAVQQGLEQGREEGREEGRQEEGLSFVLRLLNRRIGLISQSLEDKVRQLPLNTLEDLGEALLDFETEADLSTWLDSQNS